MITYYVDVTTDPRRPRLIRRMNNGHPTTFDNTLGMVVAFDIENFTISFDLADGVANPTNVRMDDADLDGYRGVRTARVLAESDPQDQLRALGAIAAADAHDAPVLSQHARHPGEPAEPGVRRSISLRIESCLSMFHDTRSRSARRASRSS